MNAMEQRRPTPLRLAYEFDDLRRILREMRVDDRGREEELRRLGEDLRQLTARLVALHSSFRSA
jgi:hypothetical protein